MTGVDSTFAHPDGAVFAITTFGDRSGTGGSPLEQAAGVGTSDGTIVLVMGHGATKTQWIPLAERFASKGFYVITFDNRGAGCTTVPGQDSFVPVATSDTGSPLEPAGEPLFTYSDMADDVVALMNHFSVPKAHIAGASMGGQIATLVGVRHPERCLSITTIMSASPLMSAVNVAMERNPVRLTFCQCCLLCGQRLRQTCPEVSSSACYAQEWFRRLANNKPPEMGDSLEQVLAKLDLHGATGPEGGTVTFADEVDIKRAVQHATIDFDRGAIDHAPRVGDALQGLAGASWAASHEGRTIREKLKSLTVPAIWIGGTRDPIVPIEQQRETAALVPGGRIYEFDCGHDMPARTEEGMVAIMLAHFYDSVAPRNRRFRSSAQDLNYSLSRLGPRM